MTYRTILVEDEYNARSLLRYYIETYSDLKIVGEADNYDSAVNLINIHRPEVIFMDISLPEHSGFEITEKINPNTSQVIFVTAYDQFAIKALRLDATDYLLKPVDVDELKNAIARAKSRLSQQTESNNLHPHDVQRRIVLNNGNEDILVPIAEIIRLEASGRYTEVHIQNRSVKTITKNLGEFEKMNALSEFLRVHHSHLVNPSHILTFDKANGGTLIMSDGSRINVSRKNKPALIDFLRSKT